MDSPSKGQKRLQFLYKYLFEFAVVFSGVFLAFWLTERNDQHKAAQKQKDIYQAIYEDLQSFHESGKRSNPDGFILLFEKWDRQFDSLVLIKKIPQRMSIRGDYWQLPIVQSMMQSSILNEINIATFKKVAKIYTVHQNFLRTIQEFNQYYDQYVTAEYDQGIEHFYVPGSQQLKPKYSYLNRANSDIARFAEVLVKITGELAADIKTQHLE
ncbi:MAG: hypothetical protein R8G66_03920 [Cytophagales bacterium]|nr:hypothetical protein [Cytophagales bacterium]